MSIQLAVDRVDYFAAAASVSYLNASAGRVQYLAVEARDTPRLIFFDREGSGNSFETVPQTFLPAESVFIGDGDGAGGVNLTLQKDFETFKTEGPSVTDTDPVFNVGKVLADSVDAIEAKVFVFTDFIDFDPSDADIDPDPVTVAEADVKAIGKNPSDTTTASESIANQPDIVKVDSVAASEAINQLRPHKNATDTATASDAVNRFDVTTEFDDTVTATEALAKDFTQISTDDVTAVQSNIKAFTSNVDFDLSDADVDPDPVTASDAINSFATTKGITDTATATESDAKNFTHGGFTDTATATESDAKNFTHGGFADTFDAVEGIKLEPSIPAADAVTATEAIIFDARPVFSETLTAAESINTTLTLGDLTFIYPDYVTVSDGYIGGFIQEHYAYTISNVKYFVPNTGVIGAAETFNTVIMAADRVTAPDESSSGLVVNFHYTDVDEDDRALGGHYFNQTPLNPGNSTVGQRAIL